jgi:hypothetical protein
MKECPSYYWEKFGIYGKYSMEFHYNELAGSFMVPIGFVFDRALSSSEKSTQN